MPFFFSGDLPGLGVYTVAIRFGDLGGLAFLPGEAEATAAFFRDRTGKNGQFITPAYWARYEDCGWRKVWILDIAAPRSAPDEDGDVGSYASRSVLTCVGACRGRRVRCQRNRAWRAGDPDDQRCRCAADPTIL